MKKIMGKSLTYRQKGAYDISNKNELLKLLLEFEISRKIIQRNLE